MRMKEGRRMAFSCVLHKKEECDGCMMCHEGLKGGKQEEEP